MRIELLPNAKSRLESKCDELGMTQVATTSRLIEWFCQQNDLMQAAILGLYPGDLRSEVPVMILKGLAGEKKK